ncbi:MAG: hypothetical protein JWQ94_1108 [Tardiphaga sp.]|nr:hypothetical protein [Tardiphaga sp.]
MFSVAAIVMFGAIVLADSAQAGPMPLAHGAVMESPLLQVRDGCGQGMRYSERREGCVEDFDRGPPGYDRGPPPPPFDRRPPPEYGRGPDYRDQRGPEMPDCGRGMRYSNRLQGCVRIEGAVEDRGNNDVATGALVGGAVGALIGSAIQNDANRAQQRR